MCLILFANYWFRLTVCISKRLELKVKIKPVALALVLNAVLTPSYASEGQFTLNNIIELAVSRDQGLVQLNSQALSLKETGAASATLMDPKIKFGVGGLPVDSFKFDEDAMTNISVGLSQQFSRGATLDLSRNDMGSRLRLSVIKRNYENLISQEALLNSG